MLEVPQRPRSALDESLRPRAWRDMARQQAVLIASRLARLDALRETILVVVVTFAYFLTRGLVQDRVAAADDHARWVLRVERALHLAIEHPLQRLTLDHPWLIHGFNTFYLVAHLPVLISVAVWLYVWHPAGYRRFRNAFLLSALLGLVCYVVFPVAPPRFLPGFTDTMQEYGFDVDGSAAGPFYNPYAAMPSLHVGWSILAGGAVVACARAPWLRVAGALLPIVMILTVIGTGNHYLLDTVAGAAVVAVAFLIASGGRGWPRRGGSVSPVSRSPDPMGGTVADQEQMPVRRPGDADPGRPPGGR